LEPGSLKTVFSGEGAKRRGKERTDEMTSRSVLMEESVQIAWDYLVRAGEIDDARVASRFLSDTIELMIRRGQSHRLILANKAITQYKEFRERRTIELVPETISV
jgi:hypothetical protein